HENRRVDKRQGVDVVENRLVVAKRDLRESLGRGELQVRQQRRPYKNQKWDKDLHGQVKHREGERGPLPSPKRYLSRPVAAAGDHRIFLPVLDETHVEKGQTQAGN